MTANEFAPVTPGEMLRQEFLAEYRLSQNQLAKALGISPNRIAEIQAEAEGSVCCNAPTIGDDFSDPVWRNAKCFGELILREAVLSQEFLP